MKQTIVIAYLILFITDLTLFAQVSDCPCDNEKELIQSYENYLVGKLFLNKFPGQNNQFFNNWLKGDVYLSDGSIIHNEYLRYNGLTDELQWMRNTDFEFVTVIRNQVSGFVLYDNFGQVYATFIKVKHRNLQQSENEDMYLQLLVNGEVTLYRKYEVIQNSSNGKLEKDFIYFMEKGDKFQRVLPGRSALYMFLGEDKKPLKQIIRSGHLRVKKENDLIEAIRLFNSKSEPQ